jgi:hypothetical protein
MNISTKFRKHFKCLHPMNLWIREREWLLSRNTQPRLLGSWELCNQGLCANTKCSSVIQQQYNNSALSNQLYAEMPLSSSCTLINLRIQSFRIRSSFRKEFRSRHYFTLQETRNYNRASSQSPDIRFQGAVQRSRGHRLTTAYPGPDWVSDKCLERLATGI